MSKLHEKFIFSITIHSNDRAVVYCLRALSVYSEKGNKYIPCVNATDTNWQRANNRVTLRFTSPTHREGFINELNRLLPKGLWSEVGRSDSDPPRK